MNWILDPEGLCALCGRERGAHHEDMHAPWDEVDEEHERDQSLYKYTAKRSHIKPIETRYNGYRFRSRLEARWAVFFDALGVEYQYEPEGFDLDGTCYLPDFWLPTLACWVEVKGDPGNHEGFDKAERLAATSGYPVYILGPDLMPIEITEPSDGEYERGVRTIDRGCHYAFLPDVIGIGDYWITFGECSRCHAVGIGKFGAKSYASSWSCGCLTDLFEQRDRTPRLHAAYETARSARFEHGEHGGRA